MPIFKDIDFTSLEKGEIIQFFINTIYFIDLLLQTFGLRGQV